MDYKTGKFLEDLLSNMKPDWQDKKSEKERLENAINELETFLREEKGERY